MGYSDAAELTADAGYKPTPWFPKQMQLDKVNGKMYWSDREGMRVMSCNLDGSGLETLIETGHVDDDRRDARNWPVGIALDVEGGQLYARHEPYFSAEITFRGLVFSTQSFSFWAIANLMGRKRRASGIFANSIASQSTPRRS